MLELIGFVFMVVVIIAFIHYAKIYDDGEGRHRNKK